MHYISLRYCRNQSNTNTLPYNLAIIQYFQLSQIKYNEAAYIIIFQNLNSIGMTRDEISPQYQKKRHYAKISRTVKEKLIKRVIEQGTPISSASKQYKVRLSTAKAIISKFRETHQISETSKQRQKRLEKEKEQKCKIENSVRQLENHQASQSYEYPSNYKLYIWNPYLCLWLAYDLVQ